MSVTSGFFNALNKDRQYNSEQMSSLFDGIIRDGIFASIGTCLVVHASAGLTVTVGIGKAWFNHTWTLNDAILPLTADLSDVLFDRFDVVVLEVNNTENTRQNTIKIIKGVGSSTPVVPTLVNTEHVHQYALAYLHRTANSSEILEANITNMVGSVQTPFITGVLDVISVDELLGQWRAELDLFIDTEEADFTTWYNGMKATMEDVAAELNIWTAAQQAEILAWFDNMKGQLTTDAATNLQLQINELEGVVGDSIFIGTQGDITDTIPSNADMLGNQPPAYYAKQSALVPVEGILAIGATSITLTDSRLTAISNIIPMTSKWGVNPLTITKNVGNVVMTFPAQTVAITVGVEIHG